MHEAALSTVATEENPLIELRHRLSEVFDLESAASLLQWDQLTYMPPLGAQARGFQLATLQKLSHERFTHPELGKLLDVAERLVAHEPQDSPAASLVRVARRRYEKALQVPAAFMAKVSQHLAESYEAWVQARTENNFAAIEPYLEKTLALSQDYAKHFPSAENLADPLIEMHDEGMTARRAQHLFASLRKELVPIVRNIASLPDLGSHCLRGYFPESSQERFCRECLKRMGFDFQRGRLDKTVHPFMMRISQGDVRVVTRYREDDISEGIFSTLHEAGHALYEQNIDAKLERTLLAGGTSSGVHESQSRLWENIVGRSKPFWEHFLPQLQIFFPDNLGNVTLEEFYRSVNRVHPSLIRTDADELTYNLHVMIRFDLEQDLLYGRLSVKDLPEAWGERYRTDLGITPTTHRDGVLQDVHWFTMLVGGAFLGYCLGNVLSAQYFEAAVQQKPEIHAQMRQGNFYSLRAWLSENIHRYGAMLTADEITQRATGQALSVEPYLSYLRGKYEELYGN